MKGVATKLLLTVDGSKSYKVNSSWLATGQQELEHIYRLRGGSGKESVEEQQKE